MFVQLCQSTVKSFQVKLLKPNAFIRLNRYQPKQGVRGAGGVFSLTYSAACGEEQKRPEYWGYPHINWAAKHPRTGSLRVISCVYNKLFNTCQINSFFIDFHIVEVRPNHMMGCHLKYTNEHGDYSKPQLMYKIPHQ